MVRTSLLTVVVSFSPCVRLRLVVGGHVCCSLRAPSSSLPFGFLRLVSVARVAITVIVGWRFRHQVLRLALIQLDPLVCVVLADLLAVFLDPSGGQLGKTGGFRYRCVVRV